MKMFDLRRRTPGVWRRIRLPVRPRIIGAFKGITGRRKRLKIDGCRECPLILCEFCLSVVMHALWGHGETFGRFCMGMGVQGSLAGGA